MTREEAIDILQGAIKKPNTKDGYLGQAIDMAIEALEQEPFDIETYCKEHFCVMVDKDLWEKAEKALKQEPKWIPVSERLPEKNMPCLVSVGELYLTQIAMYSDLMGTINHKIFYQGEYGYDDFKDITEYVKAWMPLPTPYKAESEVKHD